MLMSAAPARRPWARALSPLSAARPWARIVSHASQIRSKHDTKQDSFTPVIYARTPKMRPCAHCAFETHTRHRSRRCSARSLSRPLLPRHAERLRALQHTPLHHTPGVIYRTSRVHDDLLSFRPRGQHRGARALQPTKEKDSDAASMRSLHLDEAIDAQLDRGLLVLGEQLSKR